MAEGTDSRAAEGPPGGDASGASKRRIAFFYVLLAIVVAVGAAISVSLGEEREPQPDIAGGYQLDQENACLGAKIELEQSGEFVNLTNSDDTISGQLRLDDGRLSGDANCLDGEGEAFEGTVGGSGSNSMSEASRRRASWSRGRPRPERPTPVLRARSSVSTSWSRRRSASERSWGSRAARPRSRCSPRVSRWASFTTPTTDRSAGSCAAWTVAKPRSRERPAIAASISRWRSPPGTAAPSRR